MQHLPLKRVLAIVLGLAAGAAGSAYAQDTTETGRAAMDTTTGRDTSQTSGVQNPPGYRGMERDTTMFPPSEGDAENTTGQATGAYSDSAWQDTSGVKQNPPGYRGMERPAEGAEAVLDTSATGDTSRTSESDTAGVKRDTAGMKRDTTGMKRDTTGMKRDTTGMKRDTTGMKRDTTQTTRTQNTPGYQGMQRDTAGMTSDTAGMTSDTTGMTRDTTGMTRDTTGMKRDTTGMKRDTSQTSQTQNPPGYRGMERDTTIFPTSEGDAEHTKGQATGAYSDSAWQDTTTSQQNPAGYRGMERPTQDEGATRDTTAVGDTEPRVADDSTRRLDPSQGGTRDTTGQTGESNQ